MHILAISLGRNILDTHSRERARMRTYAEHVESFHIVVLTRKQHGYTEVHHEGNLHIYPTNSVSRPMMLWDAFRIGRRIARQTRPSPLVISAQDPLEIGWLCWLLSWIKNTRLHVQVHGDYFSSNAWLGNSVIRRLRLRIALTLLRHTRAIRVVSERIKKSLVARGVRNESITVLPIRPELEEFLKVTAPTREVPPYTFLYVGRLAPEKNIPHILYAFAQVLAVYPASVLRIVGEGSEKIRITKIVATLGIGHNVSIEPWTQNVPEEMGRADVFLLASKHEAYALTLIEAMAVGLPIITTDVGCVGEVVKDGVHGIVVTRDDVNAYAAAMKKMIEDGSFRKTCGQRGKETATALARVSDTEYARAWVTSMKSATEQV